MFKNIVCMLLAAVLVPISGSAVSAETKKHKDVQSLMYEFENGEKSVAEPNKPVAPRKVIIAPSERPAMYEFENGEKSAAEPNKPVAPRKVIIAPSERPADCCDTVYYPPCCRPAVVAVPCYAVPYPCYVAPQPYCRPVPYVHYYPCYGYRRCR